MESGGDCGEPTPIGSSWATSQKNPHYGWRQGGQGQKKPCGLRMGNPFTYANVRGILVLQIAAIPALSCASFY